MTHIPVRRLFIDPRSNPQPPFLGERPTPATDPTELTELVAFCRDGKIYDVERWIEQGRPIHASDYRTGSKHRIKSPLEVAIRTNQFALAVLLLANGFPPDGVDQSLLTLTLDERKPRMFELLLAWGADPLHADANAILDTYDSSLYERFWMYGVDFTRGHSLARMLAQHSSNRPAYGWCRKHKDDPRITRELAMALTEAIYAENERSIALLLWAGANPHAKAPLLRWWRPSDDDDEDAHVTTIAWTVTVGKGKFLHLLKPKPDVDDFEDLWSSACDVETVEHLAGIWRPADWSRVIINNIRGMLSAYGSNWWTAQQVIEKLTNRFAARLSTIDDNSIRWLRREVLRCPDDMRARWAFRWLSYEENCDPAIFDDLIRTTSMRARFASLHVKNSSSPPRPTR